MRHESECGMTGGMIDVVHRGRIAVVTLRRPPANAMNLELTGEIAAVFQGLRQDRSVRSVVVGAINGHAIAGGFVLALRRKAHLCS
jgi:enoyl-CoA hydratase/carnithine racemase